MKTVVVLAAWSASAHVCRDGLCSGLVVHCPVHERQSPVRRPQAAATRCRRLTGPGSWDMPRGRSTRTTPSPGSPSSPAPRTWSARRSSSSTSTRPSTCSTSAPTRSWAGNPSANNQVQGYDCISTGTQDMPPSWTDTTDPNADFDTKGRVYQTMLPFNSFFDERTASGRRDRRLLQRRHGPPLGEGQRRRAARAAEQRLGASSSGMSRTSNGSPSTTSPATGSRTTSTRPGPSSTARRSRCGWRSPATAARPSPRRSRSARRRRSARQRPSCTRRSTRPATSTSRSCRSRRTASQSTIYVARSTDDGRTFSAFVPRSRPSTILARRAYPNTRFRSGIVESFAASPTYPDHLYLTYEDWDPVVGQAT